MHRLRRLWPECPSDAIKADTGAGLESWIALNNDLFTLWPNLTKKLPP